jgi:hypothetical protein
LTWNILSGSSSSRNILLVLIDVFRFDRSHGYTTSSQDLVLTRNIFFRILFWLGTSYWFLYKCLDLVLFKVVGQPYRSFFAFLTELGECGDYERQRDMNVLKNHNFFSSLGIDKMKALLATDRSSKKGTKDTTIHDLNPEYNHSDEHESDPKTCQQKVVLS